MGVFYHSGIILMGGSGKDGQKVRLLRGGVRFCYSGIILMGDCRREIREKGRLIEEAQIKGTQRVDKNRGNGAGGGW